MTPQHYAKLVEKNAPKSRTALNCLHAFLIGGGICAAGQLIYELLMRWTNDDATAKTVTSVTLLFLGVLLTAIGVYDKLARKAGAGTLVPITGFANAVASPALEFKTEGYITGLAAKIFVIAGPVITFGILASALYGAVLVLFGLA